LWNSSLCSFLKPNLTLLPLTGISQKK
jgi:hypothetical protein